MSNSQLAVVILAAGQGTRMRSSLPKVLHPLAGMPLIGHVLDTAAQLNPAHIIAVVRHDRERVAAAILEHLPSAMIVDQDEVPGTGRAVELAVLALPAEFMGHVLVLSGDVPLLDESAARELLAAHTREGNALTLLSTIVSDPSGLGRILRSETGGFVGIVEQKDATPEQLAINETNAGVYVFERDALARALTRISTNNAQQEKYLTDAASEILAEGGRIDAVAIADHWLVAGVNDRAQLSAAASELNSRIIRSWQMAGVTIQDPATTWIDKNAQLAEDVTLLPGSQILGATVVESGAIIGPDTTLISCEVGADARVRRTDAELSVIGAGAVVGPFSYLRPGTILGTNGKIGAYVETKNAQIGEGSKVPHLSYVGDATIGENTNIGAGTIVANYDGVKKHHTTVGSHVRVGSKNVLVAPVTIADGSYTGAGTVVRKDVPSGSLAVNVAPQRNLEGWVAQNRPNTETARAAEKNGD
ncbi:bifunctional UDP-N-acetylglucosamine diphosphorylase/glucosamine-1-phosphate N-acetyltransferase GlmU [Lysinibacter sp. HNR]|uniref:bifunctional UDP-N-acetylglucosamine diphosphorylase/glucosamine-1-phosphate N-acetyltransferase GlmU n=1 Tax=Lysinibacter sp. HNR TaxID=3031408 RepID=UPI0024353067|nr:bifunctional UDP-N-acetylglucosamine diphosphorylase/glucosamine-1-phosphate N-acetyltransferase GlmU [Lysinibacter sp. HNR]WGD38595.1 bifunctional UDP-N-acetylglucosamine diphosphorylase/glucosamine-1-phosphate N-acetyltransferase GlmU [Lysinibacter sp. HNR]